MGEHVKVDPADLRYGAHQLNGWHDDTSRVFESGHEQLGEAASGWVGASAAALGEKLDSLRTSATAVTARLGDHSARFSASAITYETEDTSSANSIARAPARGSGSTDYLNL
ncbi:WXG100 family type VII secretion target [Gordonia sp. ABSL11-1]|uniref:WXG100 family type VII secretion target n=1 Tax=Gordonia sp. ABSL11-1 TaxID=3053924 RepID=UPI00336542A4